MRLAMELSLIVHIFAAIALVGSVIFNTLVLLPATRRIPPAYSAVVHNRIGTGLMVLGLVSLGLLGASGFFLVWAYGLLPSFLNPEFWTSTYGWRLGMMIATWLCLVATGTLSGYWSRTVFDAKLSMSAGLRDLERRRAAQERVSAVQERLTYANFGLAILAALGGALLRALR